MQTHITLEHQDNIAYLSFVTDPPEKPPTLDYTVLDELETRLRELRREQERLAAVVVQSQSPKYFVVGANLEALRQVDKDSIMQWIQRGHEVFNALEALPLPVIAKVTGYALGGGLELALACDFILSSTTASFGQPETGLGFIPGWGGSYRLPRRIGAPRAKELIYTGRRLTAEEAHRLGITNFVGSTEELEAYLASTLQAIAGNSRLANAVVKPIIEQSLSATLQTAGYAERVASSVCLAAGDTQQRLAAFFHKGANK
jgi:enoyl-CoA hydratase